jgi:hypothetical protein
MTAQISQQILNRIAIGNHLFPTANSLTPNADPLSVAQAILLAHDASELILASLAISSRSLAHNQLRSDLHCGNGSNGLRCSSTSTGSRAHGRIHRTAARPRTRASRNAAKRDYRLTLDDNDKQRLDLPHAIIHNQAKHKRSDLRPWSSSSIIFRKRVTRVSFLCDRHYVSGAENLRAHLRGSVRLARGLVLVDYPGADPGAEEFGPT